jgi:hypothetical protein
MNLKKNLKILSFLGSERLLGEYDEDEDGGWKREDMELLRHRMMTDSENGAGGGGGNHGDMGQPAALITAKDRILRVLIFFPLLNVKNFVK